MIVNRARLTRPVWDGVTDSLAVCPYCGGDIEVEEELERAGETGQCVVCLKWTSFTKTNTRKLNR